MALPGPVVYRSDTGRAVDLRSRQTLLRFEHGDARCSSHGRLPHHGGGGAPGHHRRRAAGHCRCRTGVTCSALCARSFRKTFRDPNPCPFLGGPGNGHPAQGAHRARHFRSHRDFDPHRRPGQALPSPGPPRGPSSETRSGETCCRSSSRDTNPTVFHRATTSCCFP